MRKLPENTNYIFEGIEEDFEKWWRKRKEDYHANERKAAKEKNWTYIVEWVVEWSELFRTIIPEHQTACMIETLQNYEDFTPADMVCVVGKLGRLGNHMYLAGRDVLEEGHVLSPKKYYPLATYYYSALEAIVSQTATFVQKASNFTDFKTRLKQITEVPNV